MNVKRIYLEKLTFYWRVKDHYNDKNIVPDFLPFELMFKNNLCLFTQKHNTKVSFALKRIYKEEYNIGNLQEVNDWGHLYSKDFISFINLALSAHDRKIKKVLEVGAGACLLLEELKKKGYIVLGIDPSVLAKKQGKKRKVKVVVDFYPSKKIKGMFDVIFHSDVLEHITNPVEFLSQNFRQLNEGGLLIATVPDNTYSINNGDISMLYHQHINYFDYESLIKTLESSGFSDINVERAKFGGSLNCVAKKDSKKIKKNILSMHDDKYKQFLKANKKLVNKIGKYINAVLKDKNRTLGFYAPTRTLPYLAVLDLYKDFRFFDDTTRWHLKYLDGINICIENFDDLKKKPVTDLIIMSPTFGKIIEKKVKNYFGEKIMIKKLTDFFSI